MTQVSDQVFRFHLALSAFCYTLYRYVEYAAGRDPI